MASSLNTYAQLKAWGQSMVNLHVDLSHFVYGHEKELTQACNHLREDAEWLLFMEWVPTQYKDPGGAPSVDFRQPILIVRNPPEGSDNVDIALDKAQEIFRDIFIRSRRELFLNGNKFSIDNQEVDPVVDSKYGVGATCTLDLGDYISIDINPAKWTDNYTG